MPDSKRFERDPAEGARTVVDEQLKDSAPSEKDAPASSRKSGHRATPSPATEKTSGAGPAIAERSKDAKAPRAGRQPGAYVKE